MQVFIYQGAYLLILSRVQFLLFALYIIFQFAHGLENLTSAFYKQCMSHMENMFRSRVQW